MSVKKEKKYICIREDKKYMSMCKNKIKWTPQFSKVH
jgi:hypothetical protein